MNDTDDRHGIRLNELDLGLFNTIPSQSSEEDRRAWLAVQRSMRSGGKYVYLEIGSHLGGSIQQHIVDPRCTRIISIDSRPTSQPDDRGEVFQYEGNSTDRMRENLSKVPSARLDILHCIDADTANIDPTALPATPDYCFIDGEHTRAAVLSDFEFCLRVCSSNGAICFHDDLVVWPALHEIAASLDRRSIPFTARKFVGSTFGIFLRNCTAITDSYVRERSKDGRSWLNARRTRSYIPRPIRHAVRWALGRFR